MKASARQGRLFGAAVVLLASCRPGSKGTPKPVKSEALAAVSDARALATTPSDQACPGPEREQASTELQSLSDADQADRVNPTDWKRIRAADLKRRTRVAELFASGCIVSARDFAAAALIFQHGDVPEHYLEALLFASRAVALGDESQKELMALAADRYLVATGHRQLFGSQASRRHGEECWCLQPVEKTFPDAQRVAYTGKSLSDQVAWVERKNAGSSCPSVECKVTLLPSPAGSHAWALVVAYLGSRAAASRWRPSSGESGRMPTMEADAG